MNRSHIVRVADSTRSVRVNGKEFRMIDATVYVEDADGRGKYERVQIEIDVPRIIYRLGFGAAANKSGKAVLASGAIIGRRIKAESQS